MTKLQTEYIVVEHQLLNKDYYVPHWPLKHLFLGTFNPAGGESVNYYYGRKKNQMWKLLSHVFDENLDVNDTKFIEKLQRLQIGCIDLIGKVGVKPEKVSDVTGKGYKDSIIINNSTIKTYNSGIINTLISQNPNTKVYSTWGKGPTLKNWKQEIGKIPTIIPLVSPSLAARVPEGEAKFDYMLRNYRDVIKI